LNSLLAAVNNDLDVPDFKRTTLFVLLKELGFVYEKRGNKAIMIERDDIISWRHKYLVQIKKFRNERRNIYNTDESWVNAGITVSKGWKDTTIKTRRQVSLAGLSFGLKSSTCRGPRFAMVHAGNEHEFVPNAKLVFLCKNTTADAHEEIDGEMYEKYFSEQLLPNLPLKSVIVVDNASYHSRKKEQLPTKSWRKDKIKE
jgi:hypothetical protein